jgi:hypothetical protein
MVLPLESRSYNKLHPSTKAYCFSKIDERKLFLVISNPCLTFLSSACISFTPSRSVLLGSHLPLSHIFVSSQVPSYNHSALIVLLHWLSLSSTLLGVVHFWAMALWSHMRLRVPITLDLSKRMSPPLISKCISVLKSHTNASCSHQCGTW